MRRGRRFRPGGLLIIDIPQVAVIGAGEMARGWSALLVSSGWPVALFDPATPAINAAEDEVRSRANRLLRFGLADADAVVRGLDAFRPARSLLQAVETADWIIEVAAVDLPARQRVLEHIEQVARLAAVVTSSGEFEASALCARLRRPERLLVLHPMRPVELIPLVEISPGTHTDPDVTDTTRHWLRRLRRVPVVLQREMAGSVAGRLSAAVWRECLALLLEGALSPEDLDQAVSLGPALAWLAAGPLSDECLGSGAQTVPMHLGDVLAGLEARWAELSTMTRVNADDEHRILRALDKAFGARIAAEREARDARLAALVSLNRRL